MIIRIPNYKQGYRIASLAKCEETRRRLAAENLEILSVGGNRVSLLPQNIVLAEDAALAARFDDCNDYDVFEIDDMGRAYQYYNNESSDNGIMVTGKCNSNCVMCPASEGVRRAGQTMSLTSLLQLAAHIPSDAEHLTITGGEPFMLGEEIFTFFEAVKNKFTRTGFLLLTNGRIFSVARYCNRLKETLPPDTLIGIPLHGCDAATHDAVTQAPGSFDETMAGLKNLLALGFRVELRVVVSRLSAPCLDRMADLILERLPGVCCVKLIGLEMLGSAAANEPRVWLPYPEAFRLAKPAIVKLVLGGVDVGLYNFPLCAVERGFWPICGKSITDYKVRYAEGCGRCGVKDACGGIFAGTIRLAQTDIVPIKEQMIC